MEPFAPRRQQPPDDRAARRTFAGSEWRAVIVTEAFAVATFVGLGVGASSRCTLDTRLYSFVVGHRTTTLTPIFHAATRLGDTVTIMIIVGCSAAIAAVRRRWSAVAVLVGSSAGAGTMSSILKITVQRARPPAATMLVDAHGYAFPSGHATQSVATYAALALVVAPRGRRRGVAGGAWAATGLLVTTVGASRVYLGAHWVTDVLGGWTLAAGWLLAVVTITRAGACRYHRLDRPRLREHGPG